MRNFSTFAAAAAALTQFGYVEVAAGPLGVGFSKGRKHAVVSQRGSKFVVKFI
jgi:hypothetical protein